MRVWKLCWIALTLVILAETALAQDRHRLEISPFAVLKPATAIPYRLRSEHRKLHSDWRTDHVDHRPAAREQRFELRRFIDYTILEDLQLEFMWRRNPTTYSQHDFRYGVYTEAYDSNIDQYQLGCCIPSEGADSTGGAKIRSVRRRRHRIHPRSTVTATPTGLRSLSIWEAGQSITCPKISGCAATSDTCRRMLIPRRALPAIFRKLLQRAVPQLREPG